MGVGMTGSCRMGTGWDGDCHKGWGQIWDREQNGMLRRQNGNSQEEDSQDGSGMGWGPSGGVGDRVGVK